MILYPEIRPFATHRLKVDDVHELAIEESGIAHGIPVIVLHGGPGGVCLPLHRRFFNPEKYRIILFDQRGAGKSRPHGELKNNHSQALVSDIETIRNHLGLEKVMLFGGSWGATLALLYAQAFPENVSAMILRGVFLGRRSDLDWLYKDGANRFFPDAWQNFLKPISMNERDDLIAAYYRRLTGSDELAKRSAAKHWSAWEGECSTLRPSHSLVDQFMESKRALSLARIECHYFMNDCFLEENQILNNVESIQNIPGVIVHGRYDMVCSLEASHSLNDVWQNAKLHVVRDAGHASTEPGIIDALVRASDDFASEFEAGE
jgi:proline iminopeptidase